MVKTLVFLVLALAGFADGLERRNNDHTGKHKHEKHQHEKHVDLAGHNDALDAIQQELEDRGHTVHRSATRVSQHGKDASLERMMADDAAEREAKAKARDLETEEQKETRLYHARARMTQSWDARPRLQKAAMVHAVLQQLEKVDLAVDLMMHDEYKQYVEADHERRGKFVQWLKKKISGTPPADLDSISDDKLDDVISDDDPGKAKMSGEFAPQAPARRVAVVYTDDEAKQLAESAAVIERAVEFIKDADAKKLQAKKNWLFAFGVKAAKFAMYFALGAILTAIGVTCPVATILIGLGVGIAFEVITLLRARAEGNTKEGLGAFVFNVVKGGAMSALGLDLIADALGATKGVLELIDFLCGTMWDTHGAVIAIPWGVPSTSQAVKDGLALNDVAAIQAGLDEAVKAGHLKKGTNAQAVAKAKTDIEANAGYKGAAAAAKTEADDAFTKSLKAEAVKWAVCNGVKSAEALLERGPYTVDEQGAPDLDDLLERDDEEEDIQEAEDEDEIE
jgi:hypothetical protein